MRAGWYRKGGFKFTQHMVHQVAQIKLLKYAFYCTVCFRGEKRRVWRKGLEPWSAKDMDLKQPKVVHSAC